MFYVCIACDVVVVVVVVVAIIITSLRSAGGRGFGRLDLEPPGV